MPATVRAAHALSAMLADSDSDHGQLLDLPAHRLAHRNTLALPEGVPATTAIRPMLNDLIHRPRRQQRTALTLTPRLSTLFAAQGILPAPWRRARRILARWLGRVPRGPPEFALQPGYPLVLTGHPRRQLLDLHLKPLVLR
jgi:hypothetical protein